MSKVHREWDQTTSGDLCEYITSGSRDWKKYYSEKGALFIRTQDINTDRLDLSNVARVALPKNAEGKRSRLQPGDLLVTITGANVGKVAIVPDNIPEAYVSQSVGLMRLKDKRFGKYIHYYLQGERSGREHVMKLVYGMGRPVLSLQNLRDIPVPLPDLDEQYEIVAEIEKQFTRLEAGVAGLQRVQANLKRYRAAVLKAACEGKLVPTEAELARQEGRSYETGTQLLERILAERRQTWGVRGKFKESDVSGHDKLPRLPEGWFYTKLDALLSPQRVGMKTGPFGTLLKKTDQQVHGIPVLGIENIERMKFLRGSKIHITREKWSALTGYGVEPGDVLISRSGTVGEVCVVPTELGDAIISTNLLRVSLQRSGMLQIFFCLLFNGSPFVLGQVHELCKGSTRNFLNQHILSSLIFPLPPFAEQQRIVAEVERRLSVVEELEAVVNANLQRATRLRQSILQRAFEGKLVSLN